MDLTGEGKGESLWVCPCFHASVRFRIKKDDHCLWRWLRDGQARRPWAGESIVVGR